MQGHTAVKRWSGRRTRDGASSRILAVSSIMPVLMCVLMLSFNLLYFNNIHLIHQKNRVSPMAQQVKNLPAMQEIQEIRI